MEKVKLTIGKIEPMVEETSIEMWACPFYCSYERDGCSEMPTTLYYELF